MAKLTPRRLLPDDPDLTKVRALVLEAFNYMNDRIDPPSSAQRLTQSAIQKQAQDHEVWAIGAPPVACVFLTAKPGHLYLGKLAVTKGQRGQGHARILIDLALERARSQGLASVELETRIELVENQAAFVAMGFRKTAETAHPGYDQPTSITYSIEVT